MEDHPTEEEMQEYADWISSRPPALRAVMDRIPPASLVRAIAGRTLICPAPGETGVVTVYHEDDAGRITLSVSNDVWSAECDPEWLEVVDSEEQRRLYEEACALAGP